MKLKIQYHVIYFLMVKSCRQFGEAC